MGGNPWIYSAVLWSIVVGFAGAMVGVYALRKIRGNDDADAAAPALLWLIVAMACIALSVMLEQSRVLVSRLSYDGWIDREAFDTLYDWAAFVAGTKVLAAVAIAGAGALKLALLRGLSDADAVRWGALAGMATAAGWLILALVLIPLT